ncbi:HD domain-containing protein [Streptomyces atriruber]|uniref:HD domain-containing protein n=1 Tax=Streptomyces atriruber TaxID=545121 RepID=UPI0006E3B835|nr:caspase family protein [Streptomyces atriruber]
MSQHKALLIGASDYDEPLLDSLPFVQDDLARLRDVLTDRGFRSAEIVESKRGVIPSVVHAQARAFLRDARPDDTLWILLSGHGFHFEGQDYLVPEDATYAVEPFSDACIEIDWRRELTESPARHVVFLIDACREGVQRDAKAGPPGLRSWTRRAIAASLRRKVAYVYGCSASQQSLFVSESETAAPGADTGIPPGESFSLFTRAVGDVIEKNPHAMRLQEFFQETQTRVTALHRAYKRPDRAPQQIRVVCELPPGEQDFPLLPGPDRHTEAHPWIRSVAQHPVWQRTRPGPARDTLHELCGTLATGLAAGYEKAAAALHADPWHDSELALRTHDRLGFLTHRLADGVELSPSEAALAVLLPLVEQTFWAQEADRRRDVLADDGKGPAPDRDRFRKFAQGFPRIKRRLRALEQAKVTDGSVERIRWWLYHRWLIQQPEVYAAESLKLLVGAPANGSDHPRWVMESLSEKRLMRFLHEHRAAPFATSRGDGLHDHDTVAASAPDEHEVREPLVAALTKAAYAMAVDPVDLPEIVVEHLGISDSVNLDELRTTVRGSDWRTSGTGRSLNAVCGHPAVQIALREHASRVDGLLRDINKANNPTLAPLSSLPPYADGSRVRLGGNTPEQLSDGIRFQLAEDRVQELLMGEELYGERDLAVREVYQNALDAVRYADRRREYLRRTGRPAAPWEGRIDFVQGVGDDDRPYLECRDNGIGMSVRELRDVFSQGGARFVDLPEYIEEQAAWAELPEPKIELHPNSRFGIGVLSYFMLADEIVVRTCRLGKDGRPGRLLQVSIAGPGNLFRVEDLGPGDECGTTVRLLLTQYRRPTSCVDVLQQVLWVAPYRTTAEHGARRQEWAPGEATLTGVELIQTSHLQSVPVSKRSSTILPSSDPDLWWVDGRGWLLADGLWASTRSMGELHGFVLNLYGEQQPELSVNRSSIQEYDWDHIKERISAAAPSLFTGRQHLATVTWLARLCDMSEGLADCVGAQAREADVPWELSAGTVLPYGKVGFFLPDRALLPLVTGDFPEEAGDQAAAYLSTTPSLVLRWRLLALYRAGLGEPLAAGAPDAPDPCARPSDLALLSSYGRFARWDTDFILWQQGHSVAGSQPSPALVQTGAPSLRRLFPWSDPDRAFTVTDIFRRVMFTELSAEEVVARVTALGYRVEPLHACSAVVPKDLPLLATGSFGTWLEPGATLTAAQVCVSAARADCPTPEAARRLRELGFDVPADVPVRETWTEEDQTVLHSLWLVHPDPTPSGITEDVTPGQLACMAHESGRSLHQVADLFRGLGFTVGAPETELSDDDRSILEYEGARPVPYRPVPWPYVVAVARRFGTPESTAERLRELGFEVGPPQPGDERLSKKDIEFLGPMVGHDPEKALSLSDLAEVAQEAGVSLAEAADRLTSLGYACAPDPALLSALRQQDAQVLRFGFMVPDPEVYGSISPVQQYAAALHTNQYGPEIGDMTEALHRLGYEVDPIPEAWSKERNAEWDLTDALRSPETSDFRLRETNDVPLSLTTLVTVATRVSRPFHEVARKATALGLRHEAEGWFAPEPEEQAEPG